MMGLTGLVADFPLNVEPAHPWLGEQDLAKEPDHLGLGGCVAAVAWSQVCGAGETLKQPPNIMPTIDIPHT